MTPKPQSPPTDLMALLLRDHWHLLRPYPPLLFLSFLQCIFPFSLPRCHFVKSMTSFCALYIFPFPLSLPPASPLSLHSRHAPSFDLSVSLPFLSLPQVSGGVRPLRLLPLHGVRQLADRVGLWQHPWPRPLPAAHLRRCLQLPPPLQLPGRWAQRTHVPVSLGATGQAGGGEGGVPGGLQLHRGPQVVCAQPLRCHLRPPGAVCPWRGPPRHQRYRLNPPVPHFNVTSDLSTPFGFHPPLLFWVEVRLLARSRLSGGKATRPEFK